MNKLIKTPVTVQELFRTARSVNMAPSELMDFFEDALGNDWASSAPQELTLRGDSTPAAIPPGFVPSDVVSDLYVGKTMEGPRWKIVSEYVPHIKDFTLTFWTHDDEPMTATESREYSAALLQMSAYLTSMENIMVFGTGGDK